MSDTQSLLLLVAGAAVGFALGAAWEHQRLLAELKALHAAHVESEPA